MPTKVLDLELAEPLTAIEGLAGYAYLHVLVRQQRRPVGWLYLPVPEHQPIISVDVLQQALTQQLSQELIITSLEQEFFGPAPTDTHACAPISVIFQVQHPTNNVRQQLQALLNQEYPCFEIILVDSSPEGMNLAQQVADLPIHYIREYQPGTGRARNRGIAASQYELIAFVGDQVTVDRSWLQAIGQAFRDPEIMAVTGLVIPEQFSTSLQRLSEVHIRHWRHLQPHKIRPTPLSLQRLAQPEASSMHDLLSTSQYVSGLNMAVRRSAVQSIGNFNEALGVGTASRGGDDLDWFYRLVRAGHTFAYEPSMIAWQAPRFTLLELWQQVYKQGCGLGAFLLASVQQRPADGLAIARFILFTWLVQQILIPLVQRRTRARQLLFVELIGVLTSPFAYGKSLLRSWQGDRVPPLAPQVSSTPEVTP